MQNDQRVEKRRNIEAAALEVLSEVGFKKASMLLIAKRARASNETLYAWYGSKQALFASIIEENSKDLKDALKSASFDRHEPERALGEIGRLLLSFTTTEKAIIMNRAAVADVSETGQLAEAIEKHARAPIIARLVDIMQRFEFSENGTQDKSALRVAGTFVGLLIGEVQIQQALGAVPPLSASEIDRRANDAVTALLILFPPTQRPTKQSNSR